VKEVGAIWRGLAEQGFGALGVEPTEGGLREILVVMEELGRAACPAPMLGAALANLALRAHAASNSDASALLAALHAGEAAIGFAFGAFDGDANAGSAKAANGVINGKLSFVEGTAGATHLLVVVDGPALAIVARGAAGLTVTPTPGLSVPALAQIELNDTPAALVPLEASQVNDLNRLARLALIARSLGAANRGFEMVVEYAKERHQFGQPIGKFQAIQHKLANCLTSLEGVRLTLGSAASNYDFGQSDWRVFAAAAYAFASPALRQVSLETHHTFGAIGYAEEHEAPRHFRRTHGDLTRHGGAARAREELAQHLLDGGNTLPEYDLGPAGNAFRQEVREWLQENWCGAPRARFEALPEAERSTDATYSAGMAKKGWHSMSWPKEFGGQGRTPFEQLAFIEEIRRVEAPMAGRGEIQAFSLMKYGTKAQQDEFLPQLREGKIGFCLGYSEPGSGSDLASLKTSAVRDGDEWVINGQKIWTTGAEGADYMWLAARTDPQAKPQHAGISMFIVPMNSPGITIRPSMAMYGHTFCHEFLDNVRVPADALVGELNGGWKVLTAALATERIIMGGFVTNIRARYDQLLAHVREASAGDGSALKDDPRVRDRLGILASEIEVARQLLTSSIEMLERGKVPVHEAGMSKAYTGELMERLGEAAVDIAGVAGTLSEGSAGNVANGNLEHMLRHSIMMVVGGGTAEVQRNLIALRGLNLPR
jgi:alkylation response protein AidB-like acyl-CoA dehydrogenase